MTNKDRPSVAFCMIAKDKSKGVLRALDSTRGIFDYYVLQDTGSSDDTVEVWEAWCRKNKKKYKTSKKFVGEDYKAVEVNGSKILGDFSSPRNDSFKMARDLGADYAFWMDSDDVLLDPEKMPSHVEAMSSGNYQIGLMTYVYAKGDGNIKPVVQKRERILDLSREGKWINRVHENYEISEHPVKVYQISDSMVQHERSGEDVLETGRRNHLILKQQEEEEGLSGFTDKMIQDYAYDHWEHREYEDSLRLYKEFISRNIGEESSFHAYVKMARAYMGINDFDNATLYANKAMAIFPDYGDGYLILAEVYTQTRNWDLVLQFADKVIQLGIPKTTAPINEFEYVVIPRRIKVNAFIQMGDIESALRVLAELVEIMGDKGSQSEMLMVTKDKIVRDAIVGINSLLKYYQWNNQGRYLDRLKEAVPISLLDNHVVRGLVSEMVQDHKTKTTKVKLKGSKTIIFWSGDGVIEPWDGESDSTRGIGGSEGMTIQLSRELAGLGNKVVVYNDCGSSSGRVFGGVLYQHHSKWESGARSDVFVSLRRPDAFQQLLRAKRKYLWLHDTDYGMVPLSLMYAPNRIFVLSEAHKAIIKSSHQIDDDSIFWVTRNGINPLALEYADKEAKKRDPYRVVYASSYDRGLDHLLKMWEKIKKEVPQAHLHIYYGWNTYDQLMEARRGTPHGEMMMKQKEYLMELIRNADGVTDEGRVSQNQQYKDFAESGVWLYPTEFYEISCITAMFSQALGCVPVCTPHAALVETVGDYGMKVPLSDICDATIEVLKDQKGTEKRRKPMMEWARQEYNMKDLAKSWDKFLEEEI